LNKHYSNSQFIFGIVIIILMLGLSFISRQDDFNENVGAPNMDATYHVLLTINALDENRVSDHWFLPTITLGGKQNKGIPWGATVPSGSGDYIYTSFAPMGFLVPYAVFRVFGEMPSIKNLAYFNCSVGAVFSLFLFYFLWFILRQTGYTRWVSLGGAIAGNSIAIFSEEALQSNGLVYWSHCLYQLMFVFGLIATAKYIFTDADQKSERSIYSALIMVAAFLGAMTEWSGYVFNAGLAFLFWSGANGCNRDRQLSLRILVVTAAAGLVTLVHFGLAVGFRQAVFAFSSRFLARNTSSGNLINLIQGYGLSYGMFLIILSIFFAVVYFVGDQEKSKIDSQQKLLFLFLASSIPLIENILLMQHATVYSFDRLKFILPSALILAMCFSRQTIKWRMVFSISLILASIHGFNSYRGYLHEFKNWKLVNAANINIAAKIANVVDLRCAVLLSNFPVRGYQNLLFHHGIYEYKSLEDSSDLMIQRRACAAVYLEADSVAHFGLPLYSKAVISFSDGRVMNITINKSPWIDFLIPYNFFATDEYWNHGVARKWAGFYVPNTEPFRAQFRREKFVVFNDKTSKRIINVIQSGSYLNVYVEGDVLNPDLVGTPNLFTINDEPQ